jgi:hypothetical protein
LARGQPTSFVWSIVEGMSPVLVGIAVGTIAALASARGHGNRSSLA